MGFPVTKQMNKIIDNSERKRIKKKVWSKEEDNELIKVINSITNEDPNSKFPWSKVSSFIKDRSGKQCRERWHNHLKGDLKQGEFTDEEDKIIIKMQGLIGNQWSKIALSLSGRSDNAVKNRWYSLVRFYKKRVNQALEKFGDNQANSKEKLNGTEDTNVPPIATLMQVGNFKSPEQEISQQTKNMGESTMKNFFEYITESKSESESVKTNEGDIFYEEFKHTDPLVVSEINSGPRNLKRTEDTIPTLESIEFDKEVVSSPIMIQKFIESTFKEKNDIDYPYSESSSIITIQAESTPEPYLILEHCQKNEELRKSTSFKRKYMKEEALGYTRPNKIASYLTPIAKDYALSSLASVSDVKGINLTEWFKSVEEQGPSLGVDTFSTLEVLSPAPVRFSG